MNTATKPTALPDDLEEFRNWLIEYLAAKRAPKDDPLTLRLYSYVVTLLNYDSAFYAKLVADPDDHTRLRAVPGPGNLIYLKRQRPIAPQEVADAAADTRCNK